MRTLDPGWDDIGQWLSAMLGDQLAATDHRKGLATFLEKREATFTGTLRGAPF